MLGLQMRLLLLKCNKPTFSRKPKSRGLTISTFSGKRLEYGLNPSVLHGHAVIHAY